jgi:hypothetical protein
MMLLRDFRNLMPISDNEQRAAGNTGLRGLNGHNESSLYWDPLFFPLCHCLQNRRGLDLLTANILTAYYILSSLYPWLILLAVPLTLVYLAVMFLPCLINILQKFLQEHITSISQATLGAVQGHHASTNSPSSTTPPHHCP